MAVSGEKAPMLSVSLKSELSVLALPLSALRFAFEDSGVPVSCSQSLLPPLFVARTRTR